MSLEAVLNRPGNVRDSLPIEKQPFRPWENFDEQTVRDSIRFCPTFEAVLLLPSYQSSTEAIAEANNIADVLRKYGVGGIYSTQLMYLSQIKSLTGDVNLGILKWSRKKFDEAIRWQIDFIEDRKGGSLVSPFAQLDLHIRKLVEYKAMVPDLDIKPTLHHCISKIGNFDEEVRKKLDYVHTPSPEDKEDDDKFFGLANNLSFLAYLYIADQDVLPRSDILNSPIYKSALELLETVPISAEAKRRRVLMVMTYLKIFNAEDFDFGPKGLTVVLPPRGPAVQELPEQRRFS